MILQQAVTLAFGWFAFRQIKTDTKKFVKTLAVTVSEWD